jgi:hypothetical protein
MSTEGQSKSAFSTEYRASLRERDEPDTPWAGDAMKPVVILEHEGGFGLFRPWQDPSAGTSRWRRSRSSRTPGWRRSPIR